MHTAKTVAIIGAGPGGLICASKLLKHSLSITIFEKAATVGGLWERNSLINPEMQTNFCRYTASFSDFAWESVELDQPVPVYPKAWMVEKYLQSYAKRYIPDSCFNFGVSVTSAKRVGEEWLVTTSQHGIEQAWYFDYLLVATGYLSTPKVLDCAIHDSLRYNSPIPILHSTSYRKLEQIVPPGELSSEKHPRRVLVAGGSHSGADISALIAMQASDARWTSQSSGSTPELQIIHVIHNRMYVAPSMTRNRMSTSVSFHPIEFDLAERAVHGPEPLSFTFDLASRQSNQELELFYNAIAEEDHWEEDTSEDDLPPYAVMSDTYSQFVEAGVIIPVRGVLRSLDNGQQSGTVCATIRAHNSKETAFDKVTAVINATGFDSCGSLSFLSDEVKKQLEFDQANHRLPMILDSSVLSQHSLVPDIALVGFTPVNWGVMEMQARAIAAKWAGHATGEKLAHSQSLATRLRQLRAAIKESNKRTVVPQYLFSDYVGLMEQASRELGTKRIPGDYGHFDGFICSARWIGSNEDSAEATKIMDSVQLLKERIRDSNYLLARVVFLNLLGRWKSVTQVNDCTNMMHEVEYHPRYPTASKYDFEYFVVQTTRTEDRVEQEQSIARYNEARDEISLWTVIHGDNSQAERVFTLRFDKDDNDKVQATAEHSSGVLSFIYHMKFKGSRLQGFRMIRRTKSEPDFTLVFERLARVPSVKDTVTDANETSSLRKGMLI